MAQLHQGPVTAVLVTQDKIFSGGDKTVLALRIEDIDKIGTHPSRGGGGGDSLMNSEVDQHHKVNAGINSLNYVF